jgi:hypothetical protein
MEEKKHTKNIPKFYCEKCDFKCIIKSDMDRHLLRRKHILNVDGSNGTIKNIKKTYACNCGKEYTTSSGLWKHQQKCTNELNNHDELITNKEDIVMLLMKENSEFKNLLVEQNKMMMDMMKNSVVNNTNINNINQNNINQTNNKTFNLQFFLNETCKDAMNISEFIENISLQLSDLEYMGKLGYVEGISNIIIKNLKALDIEKRPVHCSDIKREIMYVKDQDKWEKDVSDKNKIKQVISAVVSKNLGLLPEFQKKYPECMNPESKKSDEYNQIIMEAMGGGAEAGIKNKEKIVRRIAKEVAIDKE